MIQRRFEDKIGLVETRDKFVDTCGNIDKFLAERIVDSRALARRVTAGRGNSRKITKLAHIAHDEFCDGIDSVKEPTRT